MSEGENDKSAKNKNNSTSKSPRKRTMDEYLDESPSKKQAKDLVDLVKCFLYN